MLKVLPHSSVAQGVCSDILKFESTNDTIDQNGKSLHNQYREFQSKRK